MSPTVLVVDDDAQLLRALRINFRARGMTVVTAETGAEALSRAADCDPDLIILDLGLPDLDGIQVLHGLQGWSRAPVLVLSARPDSSDKVQALDAGADDYVTKPFAMDEFFARVRAALRRASRADSPGQAMVETPGFTIDFRTSTVTRHGQTLHLTPTEWGVLEILARNPGRLVTQQEILRAVWGEGYQKETHYLRVYMAQLRRKLEDDSAAPRHLVTEPGRGYRFVP
ncbi:MULTISPECIES: response regulator [unclassified Dietzia]|uniref:response regulator n=1 Tax=unclassified Dietzia TaxID=2617939 RepID=UPI000D21BA77|nr:MULTISPECIES: response regulator transcription factor [unclassified Dietzia]AVZ40267.1 DNA-binding response regulator [Dietzia sp. JS16-p6b]QGW25739.1 KdpE [Dietzia sp. DQ12-45-1b]